MAKVERRRGKRRRLKASEPSSSRIRGPTSAARSSSRRTAASASSDGAVDAGVRIDEEHVRRAAARDAEVAAVREAAVARCLDEVDVEVGDRGHRVVGRGVVDDGDAHSRHRGQRLDAAAERRGALVGDDDGVDQRSLRLDSRVRVVRVRGFGHGRQGNGRPIARPSLLGGLFRRPRRHDGVMRNAVVRLAVAAALAVIALLAVSDSLSGPATWSPDGLFYQARVYELRDGLSQPDALRKAFQGPLGSRSAGGRSRALGQPAVGGLQRPLLRAPGSPSRSPRR